MNLENSAGYPIRRVLGEYDSGLPGPLLLVLAGVHGNEPGGIFATLRVLNTLQKEKPAIRGRLLFLCGNLEALRSAKRFIDNDLNRIWNEQAPAVESDLTNELRERLELQKVIEKEIGRTEEQVIFMDLHSTSGDAPPFTIISDTLQNRKVAFDFHIPVILGLEEKIDGTILSYFGEQGIIAVGVEGGQHEDPATVDYHESAVWLALVSGRLLSPDQVPGLNDHRERLQRAAAGLPGVVEVIHRHGLKSGEDIRMIDGLRNFDPVTGGAVLAHNETGAPVRAPRSGLLLLPRYQGLGNDGFFLGRPVSIFWLKLSTLLRKMKADHLLAHFPGVHHHDRERELLVVDRRVARWFTVQIFHLFGFRRRRADGNNLVFSRRPEKRVSQKAT